MDDVARPVRRAGVLPTPQRILDAAERLAQTRGYNGFSYADIAAELGVTKPSLHYHFASKGELGRALMARYASAFSTALEAIDASAHGALAKLRGYVRLYGEVLRGHRMCLCGMLAAEFATLPRDVQEEVTRFFDANEAWLSGVLTRGRRRGELAFKGAPRDVARLLVGTLEGTMLIARPYGDASRLESAAQELLGKLRSTRRRPGAARPAQPERRGVAAR
jgi:TetR/AcrR family transcriptional repressor of nem operon